PARGSEALPPFTHPTGRYPHLRERCEDEVHGLHEEQGRKRVAQIEQRAREAELHVRTYVRTGRFAHVVMDVADQERPSLIVTTRSNRPGWVEKFFGLPVKHLMRHAECPVQAV
ncbi:MAG: universal stress protein, partial [Planctomycetota bacterium]